MEITNALSPVVGDATGFNGATAFLPWKLIGRAKYAYNGTWLQWGHGISAVEMTGRRSSSRPNWQLQWGHGISAVEIIGLNDTTAVIGNVLQWGHGISAVEMSIP